MQNTKVNIMAKKKYYSTYCLLNVYFILHIVYDSWWIIFHLLELIKVSNYLMLWWASLWSYTDRNNFTGFRWVPDGLAPFGMGWEQIHLQVVIAFFRGAGGRQCRNNFGVYLIPRERTSKSEIPTFREISRFVQAKDLQVLLLADTILL